MEYGRALEMQTAVFDLLVKEKEMHNRMAGTAASGVSGAGAAAPGTGRPEQQLFLCEHPHVYTLGLHGNEHNLLVDKTFLDRIGATYFRINRGGDITYHGYGQLVGYPVLDLERMDLSLKGYIEALEEAVIRCVAHYGIRAGRLQGATGVWIDAEGERYEGNSAGSRAWIVPLGSDETVSGKQPGNKAPAAGTGTRHGTDKTAAATQAGTGGEMVFSAGMPEGRATGKARKICAIGVRASRHVTMHGFALNVNTDLSYFSYINPCGFEDKGVTSIEKEIGREVDMQEVKRVFAECFERELKCKLK